ncbi:hypothetical protein DY000_02006234 [Brassica cretica]|uniref:Uncharacterized protein n=1 Tax=Brassica cretica TaxID=69181 RepID=A0ABQ7C9R6_BRACR|nr:hypothetical protein DY000_02006234 [Brassica cretica]
METPNELAGWSTSPSATRAPSSPTPVPASAVSSETSMESQSCRNLPSIGEGFGMGTPVHKTRHLGDLGRKREVHVLRLVEGTNRATALAKIAHEFLSILKALEFGGKQSSPPLHFGDNHFLSSPLRTDKGPRMELSLSPVLFSDLLPKPFL